jgi:uncharacterized protein
VRRLMIVPWNGCPASCAYCFGPSGAGRRMPLTTVENTCRWEASLGSHGSTEVIFHGGEPLAAGPAFYRAALPLLRRHLAPDVRFAI